MFLRVWRIMFDQTFLPEQQQTRKPLSMLASLLVQSIAIGLVVLLSLVYTQQLPIQQLNSILLPPTAPTASQSVPTEARRTPLVGRVHQLIFNLQKFALPRADVTQTQTVD